MKSGWISRTRGTGLTRGGPRRRTSGVPELRRRQAPRAARAREKKARTRDESKAKKAALSPTSSTSSAITVACTRCSRSKPQEQAERRRACPRGSTSTTATAGATRSAPSATSSPRHLVALATSVRWPPRWPGRVKITVRRSRLHGRCSTACTSCRSHRGTDRFYRRRVWRGTSWEREATASLGAAP